MTTYDDLAAYYDRLGDPALLRRWAARLTVLLRRSGIADGLVLDLACGTGVMTRALAEAGYEMIGCDRSPAMLDAARARCAELPVPPVLICQEMAELDLYGTVRAVVCCTDSVNYLTAPGELAQTFGRVSLFLEPGGVFLFDVKSPAMFAEQGGTVSTYEDETLFSVWQYGTPSRGRATHQVDLFRRNGEHWLRATEWHEQRVYTLNELREALERAGLRLRTVYRDYTAHRAAEETGRLLLLAEKR